MATVTFPTALGGDGKTYSDDADPDTGLDGLGYTTRFVPCLKQAVAMAVYTQQYAAKIDAAKANADRAEDAKSYVEAVADQYDVNITEQFRRKAVLDLDFARGIYAIDDGERTDTRLANELLTINRASPKWVEGPNGQLREVATNTIARQWRNGVQQGLLIEESRTNELLWSRDFTNGYWVPVRSSVSSSGLWIPDADSSNPFLNASSRTITSGLTYTLTTRVKLVGEPSAVRYLTFGLRNEHFGGGSTSSTYGVIDLVTGDFIAPSYPSSYRVVKQGGWLYIETTATATANSSVASGYFGVNESFQVGRLAGLVGDGQTGVEIDYIQLEIGSTPSSYIPTTDSVATRVMDQITRNNIDFINRRSGIIYADFIYRHSDDYVQSSIMGFTSGVAGGSLSRLFSLGVRTQNKTMRVITFDASGASGPGISTESGYLQDGARYKAVATYNAGYMQLFVNGVRIGGGPFDQSSIDDTTKIIMGELRAAGEGFIANGSIISNAFIAPGVFASSELITLTTL